jgi:hypothetical protein
MQDEHEPPQGEDLLELLPGALLLLALLGLLLEGQEGGGVGEPRAQVDTDEAEREGEEERDPPPPGEQLVVASTLLRPIRSAGGPKNRRTVGPGTRRRTARRSRSCPSCGEVGEDDLFDGGLEVGVDAEVVPLRDVADRRGADRPTDHARLGDGDLVEGPGVG